MPWYYIYLVATGQLISIGQVVDPGVLADTVTYGYLQLANRVDDRLYVWDPATKTHIPRPPRYQNTISKLEFRRRFTLEELSTLNAMRLDQTTPAATRGQLETLNQYISDASDIDLTDGSTIFGVNAAFKILAGAGLASVNTPALMNARIATVLAAVVIPV